MKILGIDCGTERTGYGIIESDGKRHAAIAFGVLKTNPRAPMADRLCVIAQGLRQVIAEYTPHEAVVEEVFVAKNSQSALKLAQVRGVAMVMARETPMDVHEYSPREIKMAVVGYGNAEKLQVQMMVRALLGLDKAPPADAADALAAAICRATMRLR
ncbi:crossover junction endodeoxyribonuclease RuvC [Bryobacter aggregatus]|uniref:crossover junction endodeoxyribonuclease RuvC n=1 Tax=Bryobacter aggregatus TaxID=360054 RepID=UPI0004E1055E|nr:crossover junction endodeoxyribonuclease RuvC [Bryobacter aggregatus]